MAVDLFDPVATALEPGVNLIEASAGTGKTYTVAMLALRFIVELDIPIQRLLIVTFTKAATEELKERIRLRLTEAGRALKDPALPVDANIRDWLESLSGRFEKAVVRQRINLALLDIDQAGIFTIHGFCQRMLKEHALAGGQLFDADLIDDIAALKRDCADDFWRRLLYPRPLWQAAVLTERYQTPDDLLQSIDGIPAGAALHPAPEPLDELLRNLEAAFKRLQPLLENCCDCLDRAFDAGKFKGSYVEELKAHKPDLSAWACGHSSIPPLRALGLFTRGSLKNGLNGTHFRADKQRSGDEKKAAYLASLGLDSEPFDRTAELVGQITLALRHQLFAVLHDELERKLQTLNKLTYDNLITRLAGRLSADNGASLRREIGDRFQAALIDEFQDTDRAQWSIFSRLFAAGRHYLYLIGDPKQAIYRFRGADIHTYLDAQGQARRRFTLDKNRRSGPFLVQAVNILFKRDQAFILDGLNFHPATAFLPPERGVLTRNGQALPPLALWHMPEKDPENRPWSDRDSRIGTLIGHAVAGEILTLLTDGCRLPDGRAAEPKDIAVLVRSNRQAAAYQTLLRQAGLPAVVNSLQSVFDTDEADALHCLLSALACPNDLRLLRQALTLDWFGLTGPELYRLNRDQEALNRWALRFADYHQRWREQGLLAMMQQLLKTEEIGPRLAATDRAERALTNLHHLLELIQQALTAERLSIGKIPDWLRLAIVESRQRQTPADNQQIRLENDEASVQIITMHRAKGLEYGIVFCPFLWQSPRQRQAAYVKCREDAVRAGGDLDAGDIFDLGSDRFADRCRLAEREELAEQLRIAYVALTRARYRCYLVWADVRNPRKENGSALAWLLDFQKPGFDAQQQRLQAFAQDWPDAFAYRLLTTEPSDYSPGPAQRQAVPLTPPRKLARPLDSAWQMTSYTALSALSVRDAPESPHVRSDDELFGKTASGGEPPGHESPDGESARAETVLPGGATVGNIIHALLENLDFQTLADGCDISEERDKICRQYGYLPEQPAVIDELLRTVAATPLSTDDAGFCLKNIAPRHCLKEMPFYLAAQALKTHRINALLQDSPAFQPLAGKSVNGYLTGFIDLVCVHRGRYYVVDYKTNILPDYDESALAAAMREHNYGLQYWLYTLVVHRYLRQRLADYRYDVHFGGVRYLFVRGMDPNRPLRGIYRDRPDPAILDELARLFETPS